LNLQGRNWIWREYPQAGPERRVRMRRVFELAELPADPVICISADSFYHLTVNGRRAGRGPARAGLGFRAVDRIDLGPYLKVGRNVIAVMVYRVGIPIFIDCNDGPGGLWIESVFIGTDGDWRVSNAPGYLANNVRFSHQLGFQEHFDAHFAESWTMPDFDDSAWDAPEVFDNPETLEFCGIPRPSGEAVQVIKPLAVAFWPLADGWENVGNVTQLFTSEPREWHISGLIEFLGGKGRGEAKLYDLGAEVYGLLAVKVDAPEGGVLDIQVFESLTGLTPDIISPERARAPICFGNRLILKPGVTEHEFTMPLGFRFVAAVLRDGGGAKAEIKVYLENYPLVVKGEFSSSDPLLDAVWCLCRDTQKNCMADAYMDCPWREQTQWWGDARIQAQNTFCLAADDRLFVRGMRQIGRTRAADGLTNAFAPALPNHDVIPGFSLMWVSSHFDHYFQTGSLAVFEEHRDRIDEVMDYFAGHTAADGLLYRDQRFWQFIDWCPELFTDGASAVYNLQYLEALEIVALLSGSQDYRDRADALRQAVGAHLFDRRHHIVYDGLQPDGTPVKTMSPHTAAWVISGNFAPELHRKWAEQILLPLVAGPRQKEFQPTSYFMHYIFEALKKLGYGEAVVDCIRRWWGDWVRAGYVTAPENWMPPGRRGETSSCHAWSAHPLVHLSQLVLGVRQLTPGWQKIAFDPPVTGLAYAAGVIPTPHGEIKVSWDRRPGREHRTVSAPAGVEIVETNNTSNVNGNNLNNQPKK